MRPEVARILGAEPFACDGERLARISRSDDVHRAAPRAAVEAGNIVPDRRLIQGRVVHPRHESARGVGFPFDMAHSSISGDGNGEPEVEPACAGAQREAEQACVSSSGSASRRKVKPGHASPQSSLFLILLNASPDPERTASLPVNCCHRSTATST